MKKLLMIAAVAATATVANAAGNFTGVNAGVHGGYGFGKVSNKSTVGAVNTSKKVNTRGFLYGLHLGYNYDFGKMVAGVEGNYTFSNAKGHKNVSGTKLTNKRKDSFGAALKAGYKVTTDTVLGAKAGISSTKYTTSFGGLKAHKRHIGFVPGVYVEKLINDHVTVGVEYSYLMSKKHTSKARVNGVDIRTSIKPRSHDMLVRVGYKF